jgi:hypothetical protein
MEEFDYTVQDAKVELATAQKHTAGTSGSGINPDFVTELENGIADAAAKGKAQEEAVKAVGALTEKQNGTLTRALALRTKLQNAAKASYGEENIQVMKEFHVALDLGTAVKAVSTELTYLGGVAEKHQADLLKAGFTAADVAAFKTLSAELDANDTAQELAKKAQINATASRNSSMKALQKSMKKVRNNAKVVFENDDAILLEFEAIPEGHAAKKQAAATTTTTTPTTSTGAETTPAATGTNATSPAAK